MPKELNLDKFIGSKFGRWTAVKYDLSKKGYLFCRCECGTERFVRFDGLQNNVSKSCGCLKLEKWIDRNLKYRNGEKEDKRFYNRWLDMIGRCKRDPKYYKRNITVCSRWLDKESGFKNFHEDMYKSYLDHLKLHKSIHTLLDRINNNGNYEPNNCRWVTHKIQLRNTIRNKRFIAIREIDNFSVESNVIIDFCMEYNLDSDTVSFILKNNLDKSHKGWKFKYSGETK